MRSQHRDLVKKLLYYSGYYSLRESLNGPSDNRLLILMYHDIVRDADQLSHWSSSNTSTESQFDLALTTLKKNYRVITVEDAVNEIRNTGSLREKSAAITLDDGYQSSYDIVFPILKKHGLSATIYLPTDWIDGLLDPWWIKLTSMIDQCAITQSTVELAERILGVSLNIEIRSIDDMGGVRQTLCGGIAWNLMKREDSTRNRILQDMHHDLIDGSELVSCMRYPMTWEQVTEMAAQGIVFGAHTCSHPNMSYIDLATAEKEAAESKRIIEGHINKEVSGFAYPYGYDVEGYRRFRPVLEKLGFSYACTSWPGHVDSTADLYLLGRFYLPLTSSKAIVARALSLEYAS